MFLHESPIQKLRCLTLSMNNLFWTIIDLLYWYISSFLFYLWHIPLLNCVFVLNSKLPVAKKFHLSYFLHAPRLYPDNLQCLLRPCNSGAFTPRQINFVLNLVGLVEIYLYTNIGIKLVMNVPTSKKSNRGESCSVILWQISCSHGVHLLYFHKN